MMYFLTISGRFFFQILKLKFFIAGFSLVFFSAKIPCAFANGDEMTFRSVCTANSIQSCFFIADGRITSATPAKFENFFKSGKRGDGYQVALNSTGGNFLAGIELGRLLRKHDLTTFVGKWFVGADEYDSFLSAGKCYSACAYAFIGGASRRIPDGSELGFHRFSIGSEIKLPKSLIVENLILSEAQKMSGLAVTYIIEMGLDARLFSTASEISGNGLFVPTTKQLQEFGFISKALFSNFLIEPYKAGIVAFSKKIEPPRVYDEVTQLTTFCKKEGPFVMLTAPDGDRRITRDSVLDSYLLLFNKQEEERIKLALEDIYFSYTSDSLKISMKLNSIIIKKLLKADAFMPTLQVASASGGSYSSFHELSKMDGKMLRSSFTHCILQ